MNGRFNLLDEDEAKEISNFYGKILKETMKALKLLDEFFGGNEEKVYLWLTTKNPNLGNTTPIRLIMIGRGHKLLSFMESALKGDSI